MNTSKELINSLKLDNFTVSVERDDENHSKEIIAYLEQSEISKSMKEQLLKKYKKHKSVVFYKEDGIMNLGLTFMAYNH